MTASPARLAELRALIAEGLSWRQIGQRLGMSRGQVVGTVQRHLRAEWDARPRPSQPVPAPVPPRPACYCDAPGPGTCCWPISGSRPWQFCPEPRAPGRVYCAAHHAIAYHRNPKAWAA